MFTADEIDAIAVGARHVRRLRDPKLQRAAESVLAKVTTVVPENLRSYLRPPPFYVSEGSAPPVTGVHLGEVRGAIHAARKLSIAYADEKGRRTERTIRPIAMAYYVDVTVIAAWCELRDDFRHFRADRITSARLLRESFASESTRLRAQWMALGKSRQEAPV
jgi:predicted DNA-binding transcriptional regulator YafY